VVDELIEARPPYNVDTVVALMAEACRRWGVDEIIGDHYAGVWPSAAFARYGLRYVVCASPKSVLFLESLVLFTGQRIRLVDNARCTRQLIALERRTARGGKDSVAHPPITGAHDDLANVVVGVACLAQTVAADLAAAEMDPAERAQIRSIERHLGQSREPWGGWQNMVIDRETYQGDAPGWDLPNGYIDGDLGDFNK
jgi:hypothetical protein